MINLLGTFRRDDHPIHLNQEFFLDLAWWQEFFQSWNGCSFLQYPSGLHSPMGSWLRSSFPGSLVFRCMAPSTHLSVHWVQGTFPYRRGSLPMGTQWASKRVNFLSDNRSVVEILFFFFLIILYWNKLILIQWWKFYGLALQELLPSCPWFAICPCWQLITPSLSLPSQLEGSLTQLLTPCLPFSFSIFDG